MQVFPSRDFVPSDKHYVLLVRPKEGTLPAHSPFRTPLIQAFMEEGKDSHGVAPKSRRAVSPLH